MIISTADQTTATTTNTTIEQAKWDGRGVIATVPTPAISLFEQADALFQVEKRELKVPTHVETQEPNGYLPGRIAYASSGIYGLVRTDTQTLLGAVSKQYEIVPNESLLRMAEFIREEVEMDSVFVLSDGAKVCFTANVRGASADVVPGDTIKRRFVGYLGHDGKTGAGAMFTDIRVVCSNTLVSAMRDASQKVSIRHKTGANDNFEQLIRSIDIARQSFEQEVEVFSHMASTDISPDEAREFFKRCYSQQLAVPITEDGIKRDRVLEDLRVFPHLQHAFQYGLGAGYGAGTFWNAVNAVTQVETSTANCTHAKRTSQFAKANFGTGLVRSKNAIEIAKEMMAV